MPEKEEKEKEEMVVRMRTVLVLVETLLSVIKESKRR
jgi:hypothetical protein